MKKTRLITVGLLAVMLLIVAQVSAQRNREDGQKGKDFLSYLQLNENQKAQAQTFFTEMKKTTNPLRLEIQKKQLEIDKLMMTDNVDEKTIFAKVDELARLQADMQKARLKSKIQLRSILTDEQKVMFDSKEVDRNKFGRHGSPKGNRKVMGERMKK